MNKILSSDRSYIVYCTAPQPFSLCVQPDDGLLEAETCSYYHRLLYNIVVF